MGEDLRPAVGFVEFEGDEEGLVVSHFWDYGNCEILPPWGVLPSVGVPSMLLVIGCGVVGRGFSTGLK